MHKFFLSCFIWLSAALTQHLHAQMLHAFSASALDEQVLLRWTINEGQTCADVMLEHGTDTNNLETFYTYPGICGHSSEKSSYQHRHALPLKGQQNYYRVNLGDAEYSAIQSVFISHSGNLIFSVYPMPLQKSSVLYMKTFSPGHSRVLLHNSLGQLVYESKPDENKVPLGMLPLDAGIYFYSILLDDQLLHRAKIVNTFSAY